MGFLLVKPAFFEVECMPLNDGRYVLSCVISHARLIICLFGSGVDFNGVDQMLKYSSLLSWRNKVRVWKLRKAILLGLLKDRHVEVRWFVICSMMLALRISVNSVAFHANHNCRVTDVMSHLKNGVFF